MAIRREFLNTGSPEGSKNRVPVKGEFGFHRRRRQKFFVKRVDLKLRHPKLRVVRNRMLDLEGCDVACIDQCLVAVPKAYGPANSGRDITPGRAEAFFLTATGCALAHCFN